MFALSHGAASRNEPAGGIWRLVHAAGLRPITVAEMPDCGMSEEQAAAFMAGDPDAAAPPVKAESEHDTLPQDDEEAADTYDADEDFGVMDS